MVESSQRKHRYRLDKIIDNGSFGVVYEATNKEKGTKVAIKQVFVDHRFINRELEMLEKVEGHPHIMQVLDYYCSGEDPGKDRYLHIVSELMHENLSTYIKRMRQRLEKTGISFDQVPLSKVRVFARQLFEAIDFAHKRNVMHRDIKPANILLDRDRKRIVLCDWGSSK
jgi:serine/threonine protein kinase